MMPEHGKCTSIGWHCVIVEVADDLTQPFPLLGDWPVPPGFPLKLEFTRAGLAADEGEAKEEGLRMRAKLREIKETLRRCMHDCRSGEAASLTAVALAR
jgi:hypothetical protein